MGAGVGVGVERKVEGGQGSAGMGEWRWTEEQVEGGGKAVK
ncbi:hypothetical protein KNP414_06012 [Paenibacillus mucilaginosus KNP414]|uniref:Uncharacterized protein n=1 Tax=Paenibacillus mucilaginosus (strain KNP414) TaxID=1036673 RepID=F8FED7_PAEMK|nr:hypothetical protein KNP414_06012 [Paenibacillus mucilaginosus KNP414]